MRGLNVIAIVVGGLLLSAAGLAQRAPDQESVEPIAHVKVITFDPAAIEGAARVGDGEVIQERPRPLRHRSVVRLRAEFRRELLGSVFSL